MNPKKDYPTDEKIRKQFLKVSKEYGKSDEWALRITADELSCPISYIRNVLLEMDEKGLL